jgi:FAD binding domain-containing protein
LCMTQNEENIVTKKRSGVSRREFITGTVGGVVVGAVVGAAVGSIGFPKTVTQVQTQTQTSTVTSVNTVTATAVPSSWDLNADVVIIGAGAAGMAAAIMARSTGASVLVVEMNYDIGGKLIMSGGNTIFGGGTSTQKQFNINDTPDLFFADLTSAANTFATSAGTHYIDRSLYRVFADNSAATHDWLIANGVQFNTTGVPNTPPSGGSSWPSGIARSESAYWNGSVPPYVASPASPGGAGGTGFARALEATCRTNGVQFLLNYRLTSVVRPQPYTGRVVGVTAAYTGGRVVPGSTTPLQPYCTTSGSVVPNKGNVNLAQATLNIKANKAVILSTGGMASNAQRRMVLDPRLTDFITALGDPYCYQTGDAEYAALRVGASLWGTGNETAENDTELNKPSTVGSQYGNGTKLNPNSPVFPLVRATGLAVSSLADVIHVNMAGLRFVDESQPTYPWCDAALAINPASAAPNWSSGPVWAIFDSAAVTRENWTLGPPNTDPLFFYQANDLATLAQQISTNQFQTTPMSGATLQNTVTRYNSFIDAGKDSDFNKPATLLKYKINSPPYYAGFSPPFTRDWYAGVHINGKAQVLDLDGNVIPSLYCAGESAGGFTSHGMTKCFIFGRLAGQNAAAETAQT